MITENFYEVIFNCLKKSLQDDYEEKDEEEIRDWLSFNYVKK